MIFCAFERNNWQRLRLPAGIHPDSVMSLFGSRAALIIAGFLLLLRPSVAQPDPTQPAPRINSAEREFPAQADPSVQIDELIKQSNEQMNVTGQFRRAGELAQQALDLSLKTGDKVRGARAMIYLAAAYPYQGRLVEAFEVSESSACAQQA